MIAPKRLLDSSSAPEPLQQALSKAAQELPPSGHSETVLVGVLARLNLPDASASIPKESPTGLGAQTVKGALRVKQVGTVIAVGGGIGLALAGAVVLSAPDAKQPQAPSTPSISSASPVGSSQVAIAASQPMASRAPRVQKGDHGPTPATAPSTAPVARGPQLKAPAKRAVADNGQEIELVLEMRNALKADPARALTLCSEHEIQFTQGRFVQEREAAKVEALFLLGQVQAARARYSTFTRRYPESVYQERLKKLVAAQ